MDNINIVIKNLEMSADGMSNIAVIRYPHLEEVNFPFHTVILYQTGLILNCKLTDQHIFKHMFCVGHWVNNQFNIITCLRALCVIT